MNPQNDIRVRLPAGGVALSEEGGAALWVSDGPVGAGLWERLRVEHPVSGWWPLLLEALDEASGEIRPWESGELCPEETGSPDVHDAAELLESWWREYTAVDGGQDPLGGELRAAVTAPYGLEWPGPAPAGRPGADPEEAADRCAAALVSGRRGLRLGLVRAVSGARAPAAVGWQGPANYIEDAAEVSAVLASWEERFGVRVVGMGFDTLELSVGAPPATKEEALRVAAEHFALCPDSVWQVRGGRPLERYGESLVGAERWSLWWD
ncbi:DUF4253 domain-containing protein [Nocardiopsis algeriensis]|uniref:DUF4253 domain-containing protein n=1 Tax=Nocardiopsis algeriensis TaxID=1478215 RepID=A0A841IMH1_9ACTN|nr:DUF4253 domain-containing protein [Nocardiopsis algeriensis]MBB6119927.1 hypothetical protein [Nocardiopsis algeriensis]